MAFYRVYPSKDTCIESADGLIQMDGANFGASEILQLYKLAEGSGTAHILVAFDTSSLPAPDPQQTILRLADAQHGDALPYGYAAFVYPNSQAWTEGLGHDLDLGTDLGVANWEEATVAATWSQAGGRPLAPAGSASFFFETGHEDMEVDVTSLSTSDFFIQIDPALEADSKDYYIKKFHSRQSHFPVKRPYLEFRWADATSTLSVTSSFIATAGAFSGSQIDSRLSGVISGVLTSSYVADVDPTGALVLAIPDLRTVYDRMEAPVLRVRALRKDWNPATVPQTTWATANVALTDAHYRIVADETEEVLVPFGTGSVPYTRMSCDDFGNYFQVHMASLPIDVVLRFDIGYRVGGSWTTHRGDELKFRVI